MTIAILLLALLLTRQDEQVQAVQPLEGCTQIGVLVDALKGLNAKWYLWSRDELIEFWPSQLKPQGCENLKKEDCRYFASYGRVTAGDPECGEQFFWEKTERGVQLDFVKVYYSTPTYEQAMGVLDILVAAIDPPDDSLLSREDGEPRSSRSYQWEKRERGLVTEVFNLKADVSPLNEVFRIDFSYGRYRPHVE